MEICPLKQRIVPGRLYYVDFSKAFQHNIEADKQVNFEEGKCEATVTGIQKTLARTRASSPSSSAFTIQMLDNWATINY